MQCQSRCGCRDEDGRIKWANDAYAEAVEAVGTSEVYDKQIELLESRQRIQVGRYMEKGQAYAERLHIVTGGERKAHDVYAVAVG